MRQHRSNIAHKSAKKHCGSVAVRRRKRAFFADDGGFSTVGMVLALLISVSLIIGATQVYKLRSVSASVQNVADACALAAEKQVASFYIVAQVCDSAILSLSVAGVAVIGVGLVTACIPGTQAISVKCVEAGQKILSARTRFANSCKEGLNKLQALLPIFAALDVAALAAANNSKGSSYFALAYLTPFEGKDLLVPVGSEADALANVEGAREEIAQAAVQADDAAQEANAHKQRAFEADCGNAPSYCMYERSRRLAGLEGSSNPQYSSVDAWSFSVALRRAQAYYYVRYVQEGPTTSAVDNWARSAIRKRFYAYANDLLTQGYVYETEDYFEAYFPLLPRNTAEMRETSLYTEVAYPITVNEDEEYHMHAFVECPQAQVESYWGLGSVAQLEAEELVKCPVCEFSAASVGKVAAASTSIENGFEYHYHIVAREAAAYQEQRAVLTQSAQAVKRPVESLFQTIKQLLKEVGNHRLVTQPPGSVGAIALVIDTQTLNEADVIANSLVGNNSNLGVRMAISAATLADDDASEADTVVSALLDNLLRETTHSLPSFALDVWSGFLRMYSAGNQSLAAQVEGILNHLPLVGASGLGTWASKRLQQTIREAGFEPPDLVSHKPVLVNSYHVAAADQSSFAKGLLGAKQAFSSAYGGIAQDPLSALVGIAAGRLLSSYESWDATFVVARIELFGANGPSIPVEITLPASLKDKGQGVIEQVFSSLLMRTAQSVEVRRWE